MESFFARGILQADNETVEDCKGAGSVDNVLDGLLGALVILLMLGMGSTITFDQLGIIVRKPRAFFIGMASQFGLMPLIAFALSKILSLPAHVAVALIIIGSCPGGTTSNLFAYWSNGDVALSVAMTAVSTTVALGMLPFLLFIYAGLTGYADDLSEGSDIQINYGQIILTLLAILIPVAIGIFLRRRFPVAAKWTTTVGTLAGLIVVILAIIYGSITQSELWIESGGDIWTASVLLGIIGFSFGYTVSFITGLDRRYCRTIALETGIQNGPLAVAIVSLTFPSGKTDECIRGEALAYPLFYSVWIVIESIVIMLIFRRIRPLVPRSLSAPQAVVIKGEGPEGSWVRRSLISPDKLLDKPFENISTLYDGFQRGLKRHPNRRCLGTRSYTNTKNCLSASTGRYNWLSYKQVDDQQKRVSSFIYKELALKKGSFVGIYSKNRKEWVITEIACNRFGFCLVPLYDTLGPDVVEYIANETELSLIVCSEDKVENILSNASKMPSLKYVIQMENFITESNQEKANKAGIKIFTFETALKTEIVDVDDPPQSDDLATICYTSGTTGNPKGAMLTHGNMVAMLAGASGHGITINFYDVHVSYLPLAHVFERTVVGLLLLHGASIGFYNGDVMKLFEDISILRPTIFASVPRLLNRLYDRVIKGVEAQSGYKCFGTPTGAHWPPPEIKKKLFKAGYKRKKELLRKNINEDGFWDSTVFSNIALRMGGRVRLIVTGSAPLSDEVMDFLRIVFSCPVIEGYGQTECCAAATATLFGDYQTGRVGPPVPSCEIKLVDVPEMEYLTTDNPPRGEICFRGPTVFKGYYRNKEKTAEVLDEDGWLHSGDIGLWNFDQTLKIIDRKKNIFKLAQGEYVAPEKIENIYLQSKYVKQIFVHGDSLQSYLIAVVVPEWDVLSNWIAENHINIVVDATANSQESYAPLCENSELKKLILKDMNAKAKEFKLSGFEQVKSIHLDHNEFSVENGLLTPTFKLKRPQLVQRYRDSLNKLYEAGISQEESKKEEPKKEEPKKEEPKKEEPKKEEEQKKDEGEIEMKFIIE